MVWLGTLLKLLHLRSLGRGSGCFQAEELAHTVLVEKMRTNTVFLFFSPPLDTLTYN